MPPPVESKPRVEKVSGQRRERFWFPGSAWEPQELQALPADHEAEPPRQCGPRQSLGPRRRIVHGVGRGDIGQLSIGRSLTDVPKRRSRRPKLLESCGLEIPRQQLPDFILVDSVRELSVCRPGGANDTKDVSIPID